MTPSEEDHSLKPSFIDIPDVFYSDLTGRPMEHCVMCERDLLNSVEPYIIEKAFRYYPEYDIRNTIFEYVMCLSCAQKMHDSMSKDSMARIRQYFEQVNMEKRKREFLEHHRDNFEPWIANCIIKNSPIGEQEEYQICGQCIGNQLILDNLPYMLSHEASNEITALLSAQTLEEYNRFIDDFFGLPPVFKKALKGNPSVLV